MMQYAFLGVVMNLGRVDISQESPTETTVRRERMPDSKWPQLVRLDHCSDAVREEPLLPLWDKDIIARLGLKEGDVVKITIQRP